MKEFARRAGDLAAGALLGAGVMYLLDPDRGRRRRALMRDQAVHAGHEARHLGDLAAGRGRDLRNRARGLVAGARRRLGGGEVDDVVLEARVRSRLGHLMNGGDPLRVSSRGGLVTLEGNLPEEGAAALIRAASAVPGVRDVVTQSHVRPRWTSGEDGPGPRLLH